jgi:hypothetical protein
MAKATAPLTPRQVIGNRRHAERLTLKEASAALLAMLSGARTILPRRDLRAIADTVGRRQARSGSIALSAPLQSQSVPCTASHCEVQTAIGVWACLELNSPKQRRAHAPMITLRAFLQTKGACNV